MFEMCAAAGPVFDMPVRMFSTSGQHLYIIHLAVLNFRINLKMNKREI